ncbi:MAG: ATP-binding protein [Magnetococcus sp. WYHC-3]
MNAIIGLGDLLMEADLPPPQRRLLSGITEASHVLLQLINNVLDMSKLEGQRMVLESLPLSLQELVAETVRMFQNDADGRGLALVVRIDPALPKQHRGDRVRIRQILLNLLGNAVKFTPQGSVILTLSRSTEPVGVQVSVQDTGIGMSDETRLRIFERFAQADESTTRRFGGSGLGTTISKELVELMGGWISVQSTLGQGSTFRFFLPLPELDETESASNTMAEPGPALPQGENFANALPPLNILVAEDQELNRELMALRLGQWGCHVVLARDGSEALACCLDPGSRLDAVLMDIHMPGMDGLEATSRLREQERMQGRPPLPVFALTASVSPEEQRRQLQAGCTAVLAKPVDFTHLARLLHSVGGNKGDPSDHPAASPGESASPGGPVDLNLQRGVAAWGDEGALLRALGRFVEEGPALLEGLRTDWEQARWDQVRARVHALRGTSANLGADALAASAGRLEKRWHQPEDLGSSGSELDELAQRFESLARQVRRHAEQPPQTRVSPLSAPPQDMLGLLQRLERHYALGELDDVSLERLKALLPTDLGHQLQRRIEAFDFDTALGIIRNLLDTHGSAQPYSPG